MNTLLRALLLLAAVTEDGLHLHTVIHHHKTAGFGNHLQHGQAVRREDVASVLHGRLIFVQAF